MVTPVGFGRVTTLDTYKAVTVLKGAGADEALAVGIVGVVADAMEESRKGLVTKADLYQALLIQTGLVVGLVVALVKLL